MTNVQWPVRGADTSALRLPAPACCTDGRGFAGIITGFCAGCVGVVLPATKEWARRWTKLYCCCSMGIIMVMTIVFIMAAIYLIIVTIYSDACYDPVGWIIASMSV